MNEPSFGLPTNPEDAIAAALGQPHQGVEPPPAKRRPRAARLGWLILLLYVISAVAAVHFYRYQISPDGLSYLDLAQKYRVGNFAGAISGYWSPLQSLLLVPLLKTGMPELMTPAVLAAAVGLVALLALAALERNLGLNDSFRAVLGLALIPILLSFGMTDTTPDFLACTILLLYAAVLTRRDFFNCPSLWLLLGALGGVGYLARSYILYFFVLHQLVLCVYWMITRRFERGKVLAVFAAAIVGCAIFAAPWIGVLSSHYQKFTISRAGEHEVDTVGFLRPPDEHASSAWNDPMSLPASSKKWGESSSSEDRVYYINLVRGNVLRLAGNLQDFTPMCLPILIAGLLVAGSLVDPSPQRPVLLIMLMVLIYPLGYLLRVAEPGYFMVIPLLLLLVGVFAIQNGASATSAGTLQTYAVLLILCALFAIRPALKLWSHRHTGGIPKHNETAADIEKDLQANHIQYFIIWNDDPARRRLSLGGKTSPTARSIA